MENLKDRSGLDFKIDEEKILYIKDDFKPAVDWVKDFEFASYAYKKPEGDKKDTYFGVRYMEKTENAGLLEKYQYEYDVTALKPGLVGGEYLKTVGHYHSHVPGLAVSYPEVYEVISGKIEYLCQSEPDADGMVDVIWMVAEEGDKLVMPPNYGHVSMNTGDKLAVESNIQKRDLPKTSDYTMFKEKVGGALYRTADGLVENTNYKIKSLKIVKPLEKAEWGLTQNKPLYTSMIDSPEKFTWLTEPEKFEFNIDELFEDVEL